MSNILIQIIGILDCQRKTGWILLRKLRMSNERLTILFRSYKWEKTLRFFKSTPFK